MTASSSASAKLFRNAASAMSGSKVNGENMYITCARRLMRPGPACPRLKKKVNLQARVDDFWSGGRGLVAKSCPNM